MVHFLSMDLLNASNREQQVQYLRTYMKIIGEYKGTDQGVIESKIEAGTIDVNTFFSKEGAAAAGSAD